MMRVLFVCNQNKNRSKTAEELFKERFETKSAGLFNATPVAEKEMAWADLIIVMEDEQRAELGKRFPKYYLQKRILSLDIPDVYAYKQQELVALLQHKMGVLVERVRQNLFKEGHAPPIAQCSPT